ncbi:hypothetical protein SAMN04487914_10155 [Arthrobacter sp. ok909]|uniref:DUF5134 domain-containing protein n=1 Tax=Arthrobacter sp. ok909 TaxID=1761746 RepID=UPI00089224F1|nr:DUF5134 domain-containing protein [Arthrobacter sp. ok909]SDO90080.1 hypothetical protein SAMN04487914_10155 [Arthrobacter sp. ok909]
MIADDAVRWTIAALLLAATLYSACRAVVASGAAGRVGLALHSLMMAAMALMLLPRAQWPLLPQVLLFVLGSWWFVVQAVSYRTHPRDGPPVRGRAKSLYDAAAMAAMAFMLAAGGLGTVRQSGPRPPVPVPVAPAHHGAVAVGPLTAPLDGWSMQPSPVPAVAFGPAIVFGLATAMWTLRLLLQLWPGSSDDTGPAAFFGHSLRGARSAGFRDLADTAVEVVGAAALALMFVALAA